MRGRRVLVVDWQLEEIGNAVEGASVLFHCLRTSQLGSADQVVAAERAALSVLDLTVGHLRQLVRALRYQVDAVDLLSPANSTPPSAQLREHHAVLLVSGGKERADRRHRAQVASTRRSARTTTKKQKRSA